MVKALVILAMNLKGRVLVTTVKIRGSTMKPCMNNPIITVLKYQPSWLRTTPKSWVPRT